MNARNWLRGRAKAMRTEMTPHEKAIWRLLHEGELVALNWRRQAAFGAYILDFVSHPARLVIEVDGAQHATAENAKHDAERSACIEAEGYRVLRFWNNEALMAKDGVWQSIYAAALSTPARARMERWRKGHMTQISEGNARLASSSMEEAPRSGGGGAPSVTTTEPHEALSLRAMATPPQSALRADSSSIEEERDA